MNLEQKNKDQKRKRKNRTACNIGKRTETEKHEYNRKEICFLYTSTI
jgi:hypothetical protein